MRFRWSFVAMPIALLAASGLAQAATVKYPDGTKKKLSPKDTVVAPASAAGQPSTVISADEGEESFTLTLRKGAEVRFDDLKTDDKGAAVLYFFLKKGGIEGDTGFRTRLATPGFWAFPERSGARARFYAEAFGLGTAYARNAPGSGLLRLLCDGTEIHVHANQGVTVERGGSREVAFTTDTNNEFRPHTMGVLYPLSSGIIVELYVPKATSGFIKPKPKFVGKTLVQNQVSSWKSGGIQVSTYRGDTLIRTGRLAPGVPCTIDDATGGIEFGGVAAVEFSSLRAAVSLTSEFESLATSPLTRPKKD